MAKTYGIKVLFEVLNKTTAPLNKAASSFAGIARNAKDVSRQLDNAGKSAQKLGQNMQNVGKSLSAKVTLPIAAFGATALMAFNKQAQAVEQVRIGIEATGGAAGRTLQDMERMATNLQRKTLFGDEEILAGATSQLLTFTNIAGDQFDRTQKAVLDVATRLAAAKGGAVDLTSTSIMLGKALNDPVANLGALSRSGIQFSKTQKDMIKDMVKAGKTAEAQNLILSELEKQYGGSAEAAAKAGTGGIKQLMNLIGDLQEEFGKLINDLLTPFIEKMKVVVAATIDWVKENPGITKLMLAFMGIAAAMGPLLFIVGKLSSGFGFLLLKNSSISKGFGVLVKVVKFLIPLVMGFAKAMAAVVIAGGPVVWAIMAIAAAALLIWKFWEPIKGFFIGLWDSISEKFEGVFNFFADVIKKNKKLFMVLLSPLALALLPFVVAIWGIINLVDIFIDAWEPIKDFFADLWKGIAIKTKSIWEGIKDYFNQLWSGIASFVSLIWDNIISTFDSIKDRIKEKLFFLYDLLPDPFKHFLKRTGEILSQVTEVVVEKLRWIGDKIKKSWSWIKMVLGIKDEEKKGIKELEKAEEAADRKRQKREERRKGSLSEFAKLLREKTAFEKGINVEKRLKAEIKRTGDEIKIKTDKKPAITTGENRENINRMLDVEAKRIGEVDNKKQSIATGENRENINRMLDVETKRIGEETENKTEVIIKVQSEEGSSAVIDAVKTSKGKSKVSVINSTELGLNFAT